MEANATVLRNIRRSKILSIDSSEIVNAMSQELEAVDLSSVDSDSEGLESADDTESVGKKTQSAEDAVLYSKVVESIEDGSDLNKLKIDHLKAYLRHHRLRLVGVKAVLLERIYEHLEVKDGGGEAKYPRSSFKIDSTGDVVLGDVVLFEQEVYDSYNIISRSSCAPPLGRRWVAGRVVNESYGAGKQQHTFTIEVLWSSGVRPFNALHPLLIKGRNLYRLRTLRQVLSSTSAVLRFLEELLHFCSHLLSHSDEHLVCGWCNLHYLYEVMKSKEVRRLSPSIMVGEGRWSSERQALRAWSDPKERSIAQAEKHGRGAKARSTRAAAKAGRHSRSLGSSFRSLESRPTSTNQRTSEKAPAYSGQSFPQKIQEIMPVLTQPLQQQNAQKYRKANWAYASNSQSPAVLPHVYSAKSSQETRIFPTHVLPSSSQGVLPQSTALLSAQLQTVQQIMTADAPHASGSNLTQPFPCRKRRDLHAHNPHIGLLSLPPQSAQSPGMVGGPDGVVSRPSVAMQKSLQENPHQKKVDMQRQKSPVASNRGILSGSHKQFYTSGSPKCPILCEDHEEVGLQFNLQSPDDFFENVHRSMRSVNYLPSPQPCHNLPPGAKLCSTEGCQNAGARQCVLKSCYHCCKRFRAVCPRHSYG